MKKNLLTLVVLVSLLSAGIQVKAQIYSTESSTTFVSPNTLVYTKGYKVTNVNAKVTNEGNIKVDGGDFSITNSTSNDQFYNWYKSGENFGSTNYGQLIITQNVTAPTGKIKMDKPVLGDTYFAIVGVPFSIYSTTDIATTWGAVTAVSFPCSTGVVCSSANWKKHPLFVWNNDKLRYDPVNGGSTLVPGSYYNVNVRTGVGSPFEEQNATVTGVRSYFGTPTQGELSAMTVPNGRSYASNIGGKNYYNVWYYTYLGDPFYTASDSNFDATHTPGVDYAKGLLRLTNPFTSNIDLSYIGIDSEHLAGTTTPTNTDGNKVTGLVGISKFTGSESGNPLGTVRYVSTSEQAGASDTTGQFISGDTDKLIVKPFGNFIIKVSAAQAGASQFKFTDGLKTFKTLSRAATTGTDGAGYSARVANATSSVGDDDVYQVNLQLYDSPEKNIFYNHTYVAASNEFTTGVDVNQSSNTDLSDGMTGVYTRSELPTGGIDTSVSTKLYINKMNSQSMGVPIPVGFMVNPSVDSDTFTFTCRLGENGRFLDSEEVNFSNPNAKFYFHDKQNNTVLLMDTNFSYTFTQSTSTEDRFEIFYGTAGTLGNDDITKVDNTTVVFKDGADYKVRFNKDWTKANVFVYTAVGQLISNVQNLDTSNDYTLPLTNGNTTVYVVKITNDKGEVVTKKVVK